MQARYYDPKIGRFLSPDPVTFLEKSYPGQFNRYAYTWNDPINANDPDGEFVNFVAKFVIDVGLEVAIQAASGQEINLGSAVKGAAIGVLDPTKTARKVAKLGKLANTARKAKIAKKGCCFVAGTLVETEDGLQSIENIEIGDLVLSRNPETGETTFKAVTDLISLNERVIWEVTLEGDNNTTEFFETTDDHPWWVVDVDGKGSWLTTDFLSTGAIVTTADNRTMTVISVSETGRVDDTYNLTVAGFETYFVGINKVLVHNCKNKNTVTGSSNPDLGGGTDYTKKSTPSSSLQIPKKEPKKLNTETREPDSDWGGEATKARLDAADNFTPEAAAAVVVQGAVKKAKDFAKAVKKCLSCEKK